MMSENGNTPVSDPPSYSDSNDDIGILYWVKVFGSIIIILLLLVAVLHLTGNSFGGHTP